MLQVTGTVAARPAGTVNTQLPTGEIEVRASAASVLNTAKTPPFYISEETDVDELLRLKYRYLDLRRESMHGNIILRHQVTKFIRDFLSERGFTEIETPILTSPTPEGARDYLVPSRVYPGRFYALPQSPQQMKQILMVAGFERYFQIARCFRDEDLRADRQPEFTQLDLEWSFAEEDDILSLMEELQIRMTQALRPELNVPQPFPRLRYEEAMLRFGSDKPDLRFGLELHDFSDSLRDSEFAVFRQTLASGGVVRGLCVPGGAAFSRKQTDELTELARQHGAKGLVSLALTGEGGLDSLTVEDIRSPVGKYFTLEQVRTIAAAAEAKRGDMLYLVADEPNTAAKALDVLRRELGRRLQLADPNMLRFCWVTNFPLFEWSAEDGRWYSVTHPFTAPLLEEAHLLDNPQTIGRAHSRSYDLACNGWEVGGGSIRIYQRELQEKVFQILGLTLEDARSRFGHMLEAFEYGAPPHGGTAHGIERTIALLIGSEDIRDAMAFPKTKSAVDPMTGAPSPVSSQQLGELGLRLQEGRA